MHANGTQRKGLQEKVSFQGERITFITDIKEAMHPQKTARPNCFAVLLCTAGTGTFMMNGKSYSVEKNDLVALPPGTIADKGHISDDFTSRGFYLSSDFIAEMDSLPSSLWNARIYFVEHPVTRVNDETARIFIQYYDLICSKFAAENPSNTTKR